MCNLDLIAGDGPVYHTQDELWLRWFFKNIQEADFTVMLTIFGAVFLLVLSVIALFAVMLLKDRFPKRNTEPENPDGSVHIVPFLICIAASMMLVFGLIIIVGFVVLQLPYLGVVLNAYRLFTLPYGPVLLYASVTAALFSVVLRFSPNGSKLFRGWNRIGRNICLCFIGILLVAFAFFYCFYLFTML